MLNETLSVIFKHRESTVVGRMNHRFHQTLLSRQKMLRRNKVNEEAFSSPF